MRAEPRGERRETLGAKASQLRGAVGTPLLYAAGAVALGMALPRFEAAFLPDLVAPIGAGPAIALLSAIASGMLPLTGLVFSLAFVMVQFSATAYSPRLVTWFAGSAMMSHSLGVFTATFLYARRRPRLGRPRRHREGAPADRLVRASSCCW